ncbi:hypothetical protein CAOG_05690 [Capsaspora owczarzaki ATCC 30864]|uniref:PLAT domain-containing protein n=1 Tax=Capsaspora owczarzaki (strain ATCC 30864) TaxID=595528 RepID=A0A0D2WSM0_CAPO3|nr:hypothetical protein CAOG_05690 [Capsaspora owczarzaki ATCC 30864]KJE95215.1 hypothetical protein CAOG_005690 [Capsaspora owczarzaki ATCC 30864]|eukprot:XP_004346363.1 hypothetical protein CAOG_05690 [Capsaspora owczarzaki ATCC 30864]
MGNVVSFCTTAPPALAGTSSPDLLPPVENPDEIARNLNKPRDSFRITIVTGDLPNAGTKANAFVSVHWEQSNAWSDEFELKKLNKDHEYFQRASTDTCFIHDAREEQIDKVRIRHDNSGLGAAWYIEKIEVQSLKSFLQYDFPVNYWLDSEQGDGGLSREVSRTAMKAPFESSMADYCRARANFKTGDVILFSSANWKSGLTKYWTESPFSHAGIIFQEPATGRFLTFESTNNTDPEEYYPTNATEWWTGSHCFDLDQRVLAYAGDVYYGQNKNILTEEQTDALWKYVAAHRARRTPFGYFQLFGAGFDGFDGIGLTLEPEEYSVMICSAFVAGALKEIGLVPQTLNVTEQTPADVSRFPCLVKPKLLKAIGHKRSLPSLMKSKLDTGDVLLVSLDSVIDKIHLRAAGKRWNYVMPIIRAVPDDDHQIFVLDVSQPAAKLINIDEVMVNKNLNVIGLRHLEVERTEEMRVAARQFVDKALSQPLKASNRDAERTAELLMAMEIFNARTAPKTFQTNDFTFENPINKAADYLAKGTFCREMIIKH